MTATRPLAAFTSSAMVLATSVSDGERPSRTALVESPIRASTPASPSSRNRRSSVGRTDHRRRIELPVAGMQHGARRGVDRQRMRFRNRVRDRNELDAERPEFDAAARRHDGDRDFRRVALGGAFGLEQRGGEFRRIDRAFQPRPEIDDGAEMVFMGVRQHQPDQVLPLLHQKADVGHDGVDARQMFFVAEGDAEIDREPGALLAVAETIDRQVHADLADAAERRKGEFVSCAISQPSQTRPGRNARRRRKSARCRRWSVRHDHAACFIDGVEDA